MFLIDSKECNGCGACVVVCPQKAISLVGNTSRISSILCKECGKCIEVCATGAICEVVKVPQAVGTYREITTDRKGKEVSEMLFGRGWGGLGMGCGLGLGRGFGMGRGKGFGRGFGMGRGNPYPFCRVSPWLPRRWWAYGSGYTPAQPPPQTYSPASNYGYPPPHPRW